MTIWVNLVRVLTLGDLITESRSPLFSDVPSLWTLLWQSAAWMAGFLAFFYAMGIRAYRRVARLLLPIAPAVQPTVTFGDTCCGRASAHAGAHDVASAAERRPGNISPPGSVVV